jgi:hypothetical protein
VKPLPLICFGLFVGGVALWLIEMWFSPWSPDLFAKLFITDAAVFGVLLVLTYFLKEARESKKSKNGSNELD